MNFVIVCFQTNETPVDLWRDRLLVAGYTTATVAGLFLLSAVITLTCLFACRRVARKQPKTRETVESLPLITTRSGSVGTVVTVAEPTYDVPHHGNIQEAILDRLSGIERHICRADGPAVLPPEGEGAGAAAHAVASLGTSTTTPTVGS